MGATAPQNFAWPPSVLPKIFRVTSYHCIEVLHRPLTAPLVAKLAPPVAPQMKMSGSAPAHPDPPSFLKFFFRVLASEHCTVASAPLLAKFSTLTESSNYATDYIAM